MGNSSTKEARSPLSPQSPTSPYNPQDGQSASDSQDTRSQSIYRTDRPLLLSLSSNNGRQSAGPQARRETRQEREARKAEKERQLRLEERTRSMNEEHVDGGYLVTMGTYSRKEDFDKSVVRRLIIERRIAPFWRGLEDHEENWSDQQLIAAAHGRDPEETGTSNKNTSEKEPIRTFAQFGDLKQSSLADPEGWQRLKARPFQLIRGSGRYEEVQATSETNIDDKPLEVVLYRSTTECPICMMTFPPFINQTRCCDNPICSECFVNIRRQGPHLPTRDEDTPGTEPQQQQEHSRDDELVMDPATCPYCQSTDFGVTYEAPPFRRGLAYAYMVTAEGTLPGISPAMSSSSSLSSGGLASSVPSPNNAVTGHKRRPSLAPTTPGVVTTDTVRPGWTRELYEAQIERERRALAQDALAIRREGLSGPASREAMRRLAQERHNRRLLREHRLGGGIGGSSSAPADPDAFIDALDRMTRHMSTRAIERAPPQDLWDSLRQELSLRQNYDEEREQREINEAIRQSLRSEEDRRRKADKDARKEGKKAAKEKRKEDKRTEKQKDRQKKQGGFFAFDVDGSDSNAGSGASTPHGRAGSTSGPMSRQHSSSLSAGIGVGVGTSSGLSSSFSAADVEEITNAGRRHMEGGEISSATAAVAAIDLTGTSKGKAVDRPPQNDSLEHETRDGHFENYPNDGVAQHSSKTNGSGNDRADDGDDGTKFDLLSDSLATLTPQTVSAMTGTSTAVEQKHAHEIHEDKPPLASEEIDNIGMAYTTNESHGQDQSVKPEEESKNEQSHPHDEAAHHSADGFQALTSEDAADNQPIANDTA